jgi:hypothetical protein
MAEGFFDRLIASIRGLGADRWGNEPITNPDHTYEGGFNEADNNIPFFKTMAEMPPGMTGQRESRNVQDVRGRRGEGFGDVINPPLTREQYIWRGLPRAAQPYLPTPEQISGGLPLHWPKR